MKRVLVSAFCVGLMFLPPTAEAVVPTTYTNANFWTTEHDVPVSFSIDAWGNFSGVTLTGKYFTQTNIANQYGIKLQRFNIDEAYFYITDRGIIKAESDLAAVSIYLTKPIT